MKSQYKMILGFSVFSIIFGFTALSIPAAQAGSVSLCPGVGSGYWASYAFTYRFCATSYYTWNTTSYAGEESWFKSTAHYIMCHYSSYRDPGVTSAKAYIPYNDSRQTSYAHYYKWASSSSYLAIGIIDQYNSYGWTNLYSVDWDFADVFKLSDWTSHDLKYAKHVDLDGYYLSCP